MRSLQANGTLRTLVARQNKMSNATAASLGSMLLQNTALVTLSLAWNAIGPTGGAAISQGLGYNNSLRVRCFCQCATAVARFDSLALVQARTVCGAGEDVRRWCCVRQASCIHGGALAAEPICCEHEAGVVDTCMKTWTLSQ